MSVSAPDTETQQTIPAGAVEFHIPAHLFYGWNGNPADVLSTQVATDPAAAANNKVSFIYRIEGDDIVVSNYEPLEGGTYFIADFAYIANPLDVNGGYPDDTKDHENWWDNYLNCYEKEFHPTFSITDGIETDGGEKDFSLRVMTRVITKANCVVMDDASRGVYLAWQDIWGERPSDADQFFYVLWNVEYGRDYGNRVTQPAQSVLRVDLDENAIVIDGERFVPELVGTKKTGDGVHGAMAYARGVFTYFRHAGAPKNISGDLAGLSRLVGSSFNNLGYTWRKSDDSNSLTSTQYAVLLRYPWEAFAAATAAGIDIAEDGIPVRGIFHTMETWDSGYLRDMPSEDNTFVHLRDGRGGGEFSKSGGLSIYGGQSLLLNGDYVDGTQFWIYTLTYNGYSERQGDRLLGQEIVMNDESMWASSSKARKPNTWEASDKTDLLPEDYSFRAFWIETFNEYGGQYVNGYWVEDAAVSADYSSYDPVYLSVRTYLDDGTVSSYTPYCAILRTGEKTYQVRLWDGEELGAVLPATQASSGYAFPENVVGVRVSHSSNFYRNTLAVRLGVRIKPSEHMKGILRSHVDNDALTYVWNYATCDLYHPAGDRYRSFNNYGSINRIVLSQLKATLGISVSSLTPDDTDALQKAAAASNKEISHVMLVGSMIVDMNPEEARHTTAEDPYKILEGTFYELLPKGTVVRGSTISGVYDRYREDYPISISEWVNAGCKFLNYGSYRIVIPPECIDYSTYIDEATGQTMLKIHYKIEDPEREQSDGRWFNRVHIAFTLENSFDNVQDRGTQTPNAAAFVIPTKPASVSVSPSNEYEQAELGPRKPAFDAIHESGDYAAYTQVNINWNAVRVLEAGFKKSISNQETKNGLPADNSYTSETHVTVGNGYSYRLKFSNNPKTKADHIVFYDILEQGTLDRPDSAWHGTFQGVDLSSICETPTDGGTAVCAPVVYYSTKTDFDPVAPNNDFGDLTDSSVWTTSMPEDRSAITAIAIDCSKTSDGSSFILGGEKTLVAYINMDAPEEYFSEQSVNGAVARARLFENEPPEGEPDAQNHNGIASDASGILDPIVLSIHKQSDPETGTADDPRIVPGSGSGTIDYTVTVENSGTYDLRNVTVADVIPTHLTITGIQVSLNGAAAKDIGELPGISLDRDGNSLSFVIAQQHPGADRKTVIYISTSVDKLTEPSEHYFENMARITSANGIPQDLSSETTYHLAAVISVDVEKKWYGAAKESVSVSLMEGDTELDSAVLSEANGWKHCFALLEKYNGSVQSPHEYQPKEIEIQHYVSEITGNMNDGFIISNRELLDLTISKLVAGNMGNRNDRFPFYVRIAAMSGESFTGPDGTDIVFDNTGLACFTLGNQESVTIQNIPGGVGVEVWEETDRPYTASWSLTGETTVTGTGKQSSFSMPNVSGTLQFTNFLDVPIPTGVSLDFVSAFALTIIGATGILALSLRITRRRKRP